MTREEAIGRLVTLLVQFQVDIFTIEAIDMAIEALSTEKTWEWIMCKDRLPDEIGVYLVSGKMKYDTDKEYEYFIDFADYRKESIYDYKGKFGGYFGTFNDWYEGQQEYEILAWMELPEPYKGGDAE